MGLYTTQGGEGSAYNKRAGSQPASPLPGSGGEGHTRRRVVQPQGSQLLFLNHNTRHGLCQPTHLL